jgi:hypothetical protein
MFAGIGWSIMWLIRPFESADGIAHLGVCVLDRQVELEAMERIHGHSCSPGKLRVWR